MMTDGNGASIRLHGQTYDRLKSLQQEGESIRDVLNRILPEDVEEVERIDENVVAVPASSDLSKKVNRMAGENVSANDVIDTLIDKHENPYDE